MIAVKLCVVFIINTSLLILCVESVEIECVPINNCSFAINVVAKGIFNKDVSSFLNSTKCGVDESTNRIKIWCSKFTNCKTPDSRKGTCIPASDCAEFASLSNDTEGASKGKPYVCHTPGITEELVCCPWANSSNKKPTIQFPRWNQEGRGQRRRNIAFYPWAKHDNIPNIHHHGPSCHHFDHSDDSFVTSRFEKHDSGEEDSIQEGFEKHYKNKHTFFDKKSESWYDSLFKKSKPRFHTSLEHHNHWNEDDSENEHSFEVEKHSTTERISPNKRCLTPDYIDGICKEIRQCPTMVDALKNVDRTDNIQVEYLKRYQCRNNGQSNIKVCCSETPIRLPETSTAIIASERASKEDDSSSEIIQCGRQSINDKITGGTTADLNEYPWTALLQYKTNSGRQFGCGGSIINKRYILTAAHCVNKDILKQAGLQEMNRVILGEYDTRNETDCIYTRYGSNCADPVQTLNVEKIIQHNLYHSNTTHHDIALVKLDRDIIYSNFIRPICLPSKNFGLRENETVTITGWGNTETGQTSPIKMKARLPFVNKNKCSQLGALGDGQMCLGSERGTDSCKGDSGGPVMYTLPVSGDLVTNLVGIISFGFGTCGTTTSVSTYVPFYLDWISEQMK